MATQKGFKVDINQCTGCRACEAACKVEFNLHALQGRRRQVIENTVDESGVVRTFFTSLACNHCADPACLTACPVAPAYNVTGTAGIDQVIQQGAYTKDVDGTLTSAATKGVVLHDPTVCIGCTACVWACPYGAPQFNPTTGNVHKCEACWQRVNNPALHSSQQVPACVATCIGGALKWVDVDPAKVLEDEDADGDPNNNVVGVNQSYRRPGAGSPGSPGNGDDIGDGSLNNRGSKYLASRQLTNPALKVKNRVYQKRTGGVE